MADPPVHIRCVVAGDPLASPLALIRRMVSHWAKKGLVSSGTDVPVPAVWLYHPNGKKLINVSFTVLTAPPRVLVTGADVLITVFSPSHPLTFLHVWEVWWPVFAHLRHLPHFVVANRMELLTMPEVQAQMREKAICPISVDEVMTIVSEASPLSFNDVMPVSLQEEDGVRYSAFSPLPPSAIGDFCDLFIRRCCGLSVGERVPLSARWAAALDESHALQLEARLLPEWAECRCAVYGRLFYASRRTGALSGLSSLTGALSGLSSLTGALSGLSSLTGALSGLSSLTGALSGLSSAPLSLSGLSPLLEAGAAGVREAQEVVRALAAQRRDIAALEAERRKAAKEIAELDASIRAARAEHSALSAGDTEDIENTKEREETEETLRAETHAARCAFLAAREGHRAARAEVTARRAECAAAHARTEKLRQKIRNGTATTLAHLRSRFALHHAALEALEHSCFVMEQSRALGLYGARPVVPEKPKSERTLHQTPSVRTVNRQNVARMDLLRAMHAAMTRTVAPLFSESDALRRVCRRWTRSSKGVQATPVDQLFSAEISARRRLEAERTLGIVHCIVNEFLLPVQLHGRHIAESLSH